MQRELTTAIDVAHCLYYANIPNLIFWDMEMLTLLSNKAMDSVQKIHMIMFHKRLFICDPTLGVEFFQQVQVHYNMNHDLEMMIEKL